MFNSFFFDMLMALQIMSLKVEFRGTKFLKERKIPYVFGKIDFFFQNA